MPLEIKVGPAQVAIHQGYSVFITDPDGQVAWPSDKGLYFFDTRLISAYAIYANGVGWDLVNSGATAASTARLFLTNRAFLSEGGEVPARILTLVVSRALDGGLHEQFTLTNYGCVALSFNFEIVLRSDFADVFEVKSGKIIRRGRITTEWDQQVLTTAYVNGSFGRAIRTAVRAPGPAVYANGRISFSVALTPGQSWAGALLHALIDGTTVYDAPDTCVGRSQTPLDRAQVTTSVHSVQRLWNQAASDLEALRLPGPGGAFVPAAGLPWFVALFGRDTLITSLQSILLDPSIGCGTLALLGEWQAPLRDDYRDAEPGKILHELRRGELAALRLIPHTPYYGTADATPLYLMALHATWRATGEIAFLRGLMPVAEGCLSWIDAYGDRDGDGFQEYGTRSGEGYENVGWKDSGEALVTPKGTLVRGPKALCELQGYVYAAWRGMAECFAALGDAARAVVLNAKADALYTCFNDVFWDDSSGFYALCLDGDKNPVWTVASNAGHLLWCGIVPPDRAARVVARLMAPDMWSGWGIRTLTRDNPTYNPFSYQNGSVWPHDNSLIAMGFARYGFRAEAAAIAADLHRAAGFFTMGQLPELYSGLQRDETNFPVQYLGANVPQAWAAGSVFLLIQAMLGIEHDAPGGRLLVDPALPDWLPDLTLRNLRCGTETFDLAFQRGVGGVTTVAVLRGNPAWVVPGHAVARSRTWPTPSLLAVNDAAEYPPVSARFAVCVPSVTRSVPPAPDAV